MARPTFAPPCSRGSTPTAAAIRDYNFLSDLTEAMAEAAASGYSRADLASGAMTESDASDNVTITATATAPSWTSVAAGETWTAIGCYIEGASDAPACCSRLMPRRRRW